MMSQRPASPSEMIEGLIPRTDLVADFQPVDHEAVRLTPANGISSEQLEAAITASIEQQGWIVTSLRANHVLIEPRETRPIQANQRGCLFHVSPKKNRAGIAKDGLKLGTGGNTRLERKYPPRIFYALDLIAAFDFVDFQCRRTRQPQPGTFVREVDQQLLLDLDIWRVHVPDLRLRRDVLFPGRAGWSDQSIPRDKLSRVRFWRQSRWGWHVLRRIGAV
jgi:hypothetical protein